MKTISRKKDRKSRLGIGDSSCYVFLNPKLRLELIASFELHIFVEKAWNEVLQGERYKSLQELVIEVSRSHSIPASHLDYLIEVILKDYIEYEGKPLKIKDYNLANQSFLYLLLLLLGGGQIGKKFATLTLPLIMRELKHKAS